MILTDIRSLYSSHELIWAWTLRIIKSRYQQSVLGGAWAILQPVATAIIFSIIFTFVIPVDTKGIPYIVFSYVAMAPWTLFSSSIADMADSLVGNMNLVTKIYFPREILPIASLLARLFDYLIAFCLVIVLIIGFQVPINILGWLFIPVILIIQSMLALGIGLIGASLNIFYRDIRQIFPLVLQIWFYASPIIYPVSSVPAKLQPYYYLNPMAGVIDSYRAVILNRQMPGTILFYSTGMAIIFLILGYWLFKRVEPKFSDVV